VKGASERTTGKSLYIRGHGRELRNYWEEILGRTRDYNHDHCRQWALEKGGRNG
jgi:hypothetical protein